VSCWVKHNSLVTDFDPIYTISHSYWTFTTISDP